MLLLSLALTTCCTLPPISATAPAIEIDKRDTIHLKKGRPIIGRVVLELAEKVAIRVGSRERWIPRSKIDRIDSVANKHRDFLLRLRGVKRNSVPQLLRLADFCKEASLEHEEALLYWNILLLDPEHDRAHEELGHRPGKDGWVVPLGSSAVSLDKLHKVRSDWSKAWILRSEHFQVRCDSGLDTTIDILLELEFFYDTFYGLFQRQVEFRELLRPVEVYVYGNRSQFPSVSNNVGAWFDRAENVLYTWMKDDGHPYLLFHEATHAVLFGLAGSRSKGAIPAWLDEGWAEYMESIIRSPELGRVLIDRYATNRHHLDAVRSAEKPYTLHRVLNFKSDDYGASTRQELKYAQSYTLFWYLLTAREGEYEQQLYAFIRTAMAGKGQASTFRRMFAQDLQDIELGHLQRHR